MLNKTDIHLLLQGVELLQNQTEINAKVFGEMDLPGTHNLEIIKEYYMQRKEFLKNLKQKLLNYEALKTTEITTG
ncbi:MAG TPA: hypothetical protein PLN30_00395 [Ferruginibacter sp.]|nr:hypothetical protein [Ferruginibacter sp.]